MNTCLFWGFKRKLDAYRDSARQRESKPLKNKVQINSDYHFLAAISLLTTERRQVLIRETSSVWILSCTRWCCVRTIHSAREKVGLFLATVLPSWACPRTLTFVLLPESFDFCPAFWLLYWGLYGSSFPSLLSDFLSCLCYNLITLGF